MMNKIDKKIFNRRVYSNSINFFVFLITCGIVFMVAYEYKLPFLLSLIINIFVYIVYFGLVPKLTNGYTLGGFITQMRLFSLNKMPINIPDFYRRAFDIFVFYWKTIYTHEIKINNFHQWKPDIKYNITLLPNSFDFQNLDTRDNWQEVDYYLYYFPTLFKNFFLVMFIFMLVDNIFKYIINLFN